MEEINLLDFLNSTHSLHSLDYAKCNDELVNFLDLMTEDEQFTQKIDLGIMYVNQKTSDQYVVIDGMNRLVSLSLLLHAVCECYKKTTKKNESAIKTIRQKYLFDNSKIKLRLNKDDAEIYAKIINGERLSGHEKDSALFRLLHNFWSQIKNEQLQAASIFTMLKKIKVLLVETNNISKRDLYYKLNSNNTNLNQLLLIQDYLKENQVDKQWIKLENLFGNNKNDIINFFKDFFVTKFNYKKFKPDRLYENFINYFDTMKQYSPSRNVIEKILAYAELYHDILYVNFKNEDIRRAFIQIKKHNGEDTYAYILDVYKDYLDNNISETIFLEILNTIDEYLRNRRTHEHNIEFNELIQYLNAFITCK